MSAALIHFRVHFVGGDKIDVNAADAKKAREAALEKRPGAIVSKIKTVKGA